METVRIKKKNLLWYIENGVASQTQHRRWSKWTIKAYHTLDGNANITSFSFPNIGKRYCINIFGREAGIRYYGEVTKTSAVKRRDIREIPKNSDEAYYRFEIKEWKELNIPLVAKEVRDFPFFTNMFLLQHCPDVPDLHISSEEEYRLYIEVRRLANDASVNETDAEPGFKYDDKTIIMENGDIVVLKDGTKIEQISIETFMRKPRESMRVIAK